MNRKGELHFHDFLTGIRTGRNISPEQLCHGLCSASMMRRIETGERLPDKFMRDRLLERLGVDNDGFEDFLQQEEHALWQDRQTLLHAVETGDTETARKLLEFHKAEKRWDNILWRQFCLTMEAQIMQSQETPRYKLCIVFGKALELTVPDVASGTWQSGLLAAQEWNLLLEYIRYGGNAGVMPANEICDNYRIWAYGKLLNALKASSISPYSCAKIFPKTAYYLCLEQMQFPNGTLRHQAMLSICARALETLRKTERMYYLCELLDITEQLLERKERENTADCPESLMSFAKQIREWRSVLSGIFRDYGIPEQMENCCYLYWQTQNHKIGDVARKRRKMLGLSVDELCEGICSQRTLRRLENNKTNTQRAIVEELFERLGLSPEYQRTEIVTKTYEAIVLYRNAKKALHNHNTETVDRIVGLLSGLLDMRIAINRQAIQHINILNQLQKQELSREECVSRLKTLLEDTISLKHVIHAENSYLTRTELRCLYHIAQNVNDAESSLYMDLLLRLCDEYISENDIRTYISIYGLMMNSIASYRCHQGNHTESTQMTEQLMAECLSLRRMDMLHLFLYNKLRNQTEAAEENIPVAQELQKCMQLARLCKDTLYEEFFLSKMNNLPS